MIKLYRYTLLLFLRSKTLVAAYLAIIALMLWHFGQALTTRTTAPFLIAGVMVSPLIIYVILLVVIGYELAVKLHTNKTVGYLAACRRGLLRAYGAIMASLVTISVVPFVVSLTTTVIVYYYRGLDYYPPFLAHMLMVSVLYFGGSTIIGGLLGTAMAAKLKTRRLAVYSLTVALFLFNTVSFPQVPFTIPLLLFDSYRTERILYYIRDFFVLAPREPDSMFMVYPIYGFPLEPTRWILAAFWLVFLPLLVLSETVRRRAKKAVLVAALLAVSLAVGLFSQRGSRLVLDMRVESLFYYDQIYYIMRNPPRGDHRDQRAEFAIEEYSMKLTIGNELHAEVEVTVDNPSLPNYEFTLYHGYILKSVRTENGEIPFSRKGDFVGIGELNGADKLVFRYYGKSPQYYANRQAVTLPGYFAYYPKAGRTDIWDLDRHGYVINLSPSESDYTVDVRSSLEIFSNLPGSDNSFRGRSNAVSLFAGMYGEVAEGIYAEPALRPRHLPKREYILEAERILTEAFDRLDREMPFAALSDKKFFRVPKTIGVGSGTDDLVIMSDHITSGTVYSGEDIASRIIDFVTSKAVDGPWPWLRKEYYTRYLLGLYDETALEKQGPVDVDLLLEEIAEWQSLDAKYSGMNWEIYDRMSEQEKATYEADTRRRSDLDGATEEKAARYLFGQSPRKEEHLRIFYDHFTSAGGDGQFGVVELVQRLLREELGS